MKIVDETSICNNSKNLLNYLSKLNDDVVIHIDDECTGIFLPDYVNELKKC